MAKAILTKIIVTIIGGAIGGAIILLFRLDLVIADMVGDQPAAVVGTALLVCALAGIAALCCWVALDLEERILGWVSPRPALGSLPFHSSRIEVSMGQSEVRVIIALHNDSERLVHFEARARGRLNGIEWKNAQGANVLTFSGYVAANREMSFMTAAKVPLQVNEGRLKIEGIMDYEVTYRYPNSRRFRLTGKTIKFANNPPAANPLQQFEETKVSQIGNEREA